MSEDVKAFVKEIMHGGAGAPPAPRGADRGLREIRPRRNRAVVAHPKDFGPRLHANWVNVPHVTQHDEADITKLEEKRSALKEQAQQRGIKVTALAFIIRAVRSGARRDAAFQVIPRA